MLHVDTHSNNWKTTLDKKEEWLLEKNWVRKCASSSVVQCWLHCFLLYLVAIFSFVYWYCFGARLCIYFPLLHDNCIGKDLNPERGCSKTKRMRVESPKRACDMVPASLIFLLASFFVVHSGKRVGPIYPPSVHVSLDASCISENSRRLVNDKITELIRLSELINFPEIWLGWKWLGLYEHGTIIVSGVNPRLLRTLQRK